LIKRVPSSNHGASRERLTIYKRTREMEPPLLKAKVKGKRGGVGKGGTGIHHSTIKKMPGKIRGRKK